MILLVSLNLIFYITYNCPSFWKNRERLVFGVFQIYLSCSSSISCFAGDSFSFHRSSQQLIQLMTLISYACEKLARRSLSLLLTQMPTYRIQCYECINLEQCYECINLQQLELYTFMNSLRLFQQVLIFKVNLITKSCPLPFFSHMVFFSYIIARILNTVSVFLLY